MPDPPIFRSIRSGDRYAWIPPGKSQNICPICREPFEYWPHRDEVVLRDDGNYIHRKCEGK